MENYSSLSHTGKWRIKQPAKFYYLRTLLFILLLMSGGSLSILKAQKFDPSLVGASFVLPLQQADWPLKISTDAQLFVDDFLSTQCQKWFVSIISQQNTLETRLLRQVMPTGQSYLIRKPSSIECITMVATV